MSNIGNINLNGTDYNLKASVTETDPTVPSHVKSITQQDITNWNNKSNFSGNYNDLTNKPTIPDELKDLTDDSTHRTVTDTEKTTWNNKSDFSGNYNDLTNKPTIPDVSNYYTKTEANANFAEKVYTVANSNGVIGTSDTEAYSQLLYQLNRYLNEGNFNLTTVYKDLNRSDRPYVFKYYIADAYASTNYGRFDIYAKVFPAGYNIEMSNATSYGIKYAEIKTESWFSAYIPLSEFNNKNITDVYNNNSLTSKGLKGSTAYSYFVFNSSNLKVLGIENTTAYTPTTDYHPATKKYVDDIVGDINTTLEAIIGGGT